MVSITISVPEETRKLMKRFPEINWSGFVRASIETRAKQLAWKHEMLEKLRQEDESGFKDWCIELGQKVNEGVAKELKKKKLL